MQMSSSLLSDHVAAPIVDQSSSTVILPKQRGCALHPGPACLLKTLIHAEYLFETSSL